MLSPFLQNVNIVIIENRDKLHQQINTVEATTQFILLQKRQNRIQVLMMEFGRLGTPKYELENQGS